MRAPRGAFAVRLIVLISAARNETKRNAVAPQSAVALVFFNGNLAWPCAVCVHVQWERCASNRTREFTLAFADSHNTQSSFRTEHYAQIRNIRVCCTAHCARRRRDYYSEFALRTADTTQACANSLRRQNIQKSAEINFLQKFEFQVLAAVAHRHAAQVWFAWFAPHTLHPPTQLRVRRSISKAAKSRFW